MPTTYKWIGTTSGDPTVSTNYSPNGNPATGDTLVLDKDAIRSMAGADLHTILLAALLIYQDFSGTYSVGTTAVPLKIGATKLDIGVPGDPSQNASGPAGLILDIGTSPSTITILNTGQGNTDAGYENLRLTAVNAANIFTLAGGQASVGIGTNLIGDTPTMGTITVSGGILNMGAALTWSVLSVEGSGRVLCRSGGAGTVVTVNGNGRLTLLGDFAIGTCNIYNAGSVIASNRKSSGASFLNLVRDGGGAMLDFAQNPAAVTVTTLQKGEGSLKVAGSGQLTVTTLLAIAGTRLVETVSFQ